MMSVFDFLPGQSVPSQALPMLHYSSQSGAYVILYLHHVKYAYFTYTTLSTPVHKFRTSTGRKIDDGGTLCPPCMIFYSASSGCESTGKPADRPLSGAEVGFLRVPFHLRPSSRTFITGQLRAARKLRRIPPV